MKKTLIFVLKLRFDKCENVYYEAGLTDFIRKHKDLSEDLVTVTEYPDGVGIMFDLLRDISKINDYPEYLMYLSDWIYYLGTNSIIEAYVFDGGTEERPMFSIPRNENSCSNDYEIKVGGLSYSTEYIYPCIFGFLIVGEIVIKIDSDQSYIYRYLEVPNFRIKTPGGEILREKGRPIDEDLLQKYELVLDKVLRAPGFENVYLNVQRK